jgi:hypothetical protein
MKLTGSGHTVQVIRALVEIGWTIEESPQNGLLRRNGQLLSLVWGRKAAAFRIFVYKITGSGRNSHERRVEITTTYQKGLESARGYDDIVLGFDPAREIFVGVDARRMEHGGKTGNASSFIDPEGLAEASDRTITIIRRSSQIFGIEQHAYFKASRLAEYLVNANDIHRGVYDGGGDFSKNRRVAFRSFLQVPATAEIGTQVTLHGPVNARLSKRITEGALKAYEEGNARKLRALNLTPAELNQIAARLQEIGLRGEEFVVRSEMARLRRAGRADLAAKVSWVSQSRPYEGYDILSFEESSQQRFIEVKATPRTRKIFPMTENEWRVAGDKADRYFIYRVTNVFAKPSITLFRDPVALERQGKLRRHPLAWIVSYG